MAQGCKYPCLEPKEIGEAIDKAIEVMKISQAQTLT